MDAEPGEEGIQERKIRTARNYKNHSTQRKEQGLEGWSSGSAYDTDMGRNAFNGRP